MAGSTAACSPAPGTGGSTTSAPARTSSTWRSSWRRSRSSSKTARSRSASDPVADGLADGLDLIRRGEFFAAHEALEDAWRAADGPERDFFQGLVHVAVAWYQAGRGNQVGCERQLAKAERRLAPYAPAHRDVDVATLLASVRAAAAVAPNSLDLPPPDL